MPDTALDVYRRWTRDGRTVFAGGKWPFGVSVTVIFRGREPQREPTWWLEGSYGVSSRPISAAKANALCRAQAVGELMEKHCSIGRYYRGAMEHEILDDENNELGLCANLDDALAEALARVNTRP